MTHNIINPKILVVDDDPSVRMLMSEILTVEGMNVQLAVDGEEALRIFREFSPDLVLMDVVMPGINGFDVCRELRGTGLAEEFPIILMTGHDDDRSVHEAYQAGATYFLGKPINWLLLPHQIHYYLRAADSAHKLRAFLQISRKMSSSVELGALMQEIVHLSTQVMNIGSGALYLLQENNIRLAATTPPLPQDVPEYFRTAALNDHPHINAVFQSGNPVYIGDSRLATLTPAEAEVIRLRNLRSSLFLPIHARDKIIGVLILSSTDNVRIFSEEDISLLQGLADQAGQKIENIRNIDSIKKYAAEMEQEIAERKQVEQALLLKSEEMEHFVYIVSHDFKSPVITIKTFLRILEEDIRDAKPEQIAADLDYIFGAADKIEALLKALQKLSQAVKVGAKAEVLPARHLIENCLTVLAGILQKHRIKISIGDIPHALCGDPLHFGHIWQNLIENAVKYMGDQSQPGIEIGAKKQHGEVVFYVSDNGMGIAPEQQQRIFGLFTRLNPGGEGTGLGLALVKKIVSIYQGRIWVESAGEGQGSCFYFTLPGALESED